ncbi:MAG: hypothetical protein ACRDIY_04050 [Chloroflexota bacterium]
MAVTRVRGELHCYNCGYIAAKFEGEHAGGNLRARLITPANGPGVRRRPGAPPRCGRCGGRLFMEDIEVIRPGMPTENAPIVPLASLFFANAGAGE